MNQLQTEGETTVSPTTESPVVTDAIIVTETPAPEAPASDATAPTPEATKPSYLKYVLLGIAVSVVLGSAYVLYTRTQKDTAAIVNGTRITQTELNENIAMMTKSAAAQGMDVADATIVEGIRTQALENLISNALLLGAAKAAGKSTNEAAVQSGYDALVKEVGGEDELKSRMETVGLTSEILMKNISDRLMVDAYIESVTDIKSLTVTDEEVAAYLDSLKTGGVKLPPLDEIEPQIKQTLLGEKQQKVVTDLIAKLRAEGDIEITETE